MDRFIISLVFYALGIQACESLAWVIYSKILEGTEQGLMMGWIGSVSALAGMAVPIAAGYAYNVRPTQLVSSQSMSSRDDSHIKPCHVKVMSSHSDKVLSPWSSDPILLHPPTL